MRSKAEALAKPLKGDRWRNEHNEEYTVRWCNGTEIGDQCTEGINNPTEVLHNSLKTWRGFMKDAEYLGGAE
jgi:hypothetical protein